MERIQVIGLPLNYFQVNELVEGINLLFWFIVAIFHFCLMVTVFVKLFKNESIGFRHMLVWILIITCLPIAGSLLYISYFWKREKKC